MFRNRDSSPIQIYEDPEDGFAGCSSPFMGFIYEPSPDYPNYWVAVRRMTPEELAEEERQKLQEEAQALQSTAQRQAQEIGDTSVTALYRLSNAAGELLYAGISAKPLQRWIQHAIDKEWWPEVAQFSLTWFDSLTEARAMETHAIRTEHPLHNVVHNGA
ncbi:hypothetical protein [Streptomyces sp. NPDC051994]|uniref:hypothetical protein n=1 Tax=unclassified Streptomyces TaxID=2593676 RepID=UPI00342E8BED